MLYTLPSVETSLAASEPLSAVSEAPVSGAFVSVDELPHAARLPAITKDNATASTFFIFFIMIYLLKLYTLSVLLNYFDQLYTDFMHTL